MSHLADKLSPKFCHHQRFFAIILSGILDYYFGWVSFNGVIQFLKKYFYFYLLALLLDDIITQFKLQAKEALVSSANGL